jgi:antitoxin FitA
MRLMRMPSLQIRDLPEDVYDALAERGRRERRSLAQQAVVELSQMPELERRRTREALIDQLRKAPKVVSKGALDPVRLIREDRQR